MNGRTPRRYIARFAPPPVSAPELEPVPAPVKQLEPTQPVSNMGYPVSAKQEQFEKQLKEAVAKKYGSFTWDPVAVADEPKWGQGLSEFAYKKWKATQLLDTVTYNPKAAGTYWYYPDAESSAIKQSDAVVQPVFGNSTPPISNSSAVAPAKPADFTFPDGRLIVESGLLYVENMVFDVRDVTCGTQSSLSEKHSVYDLAAGERWVRFRQLTGAIAKIDSLMGCLLNWYTHWVELKVALVFDGMVGPNMSRRRVRLANRGEVTAISSGNTKTLTPLLLAIA